MEIRCGIDVYKRQVNNREEEEVGRKVSGVSVLKNSSLNEMSLALSLIHI